MIYQVTAEPRKDQPQGRAVVREIEADTPEVAMTLAGLLESGMNPQELQK